MRQSTLVLWTAAALWGCGDGGGNVGPPQPVDLTDSWSFSITRLTTPGAGFYCTVTGTMELDQTGTAFEGTYHVSSAKCTNGNDAGSGDGRVVNGAVYAGDSVHFHFDDDNFDQHGVVSPSRTSMSGRTTWVSDDEGSILTATGNWSAHR